MTPSWPEHRLLRGLPGGEQGRLGWPRSSNATLSAAGCRRRLNIAVVELLAPKRPYVSTKSRNRPLNQTGKLGQRAVLSTPAHAIQETSEVSSRASAPPSSTAISNEMESVESHLISRRTLTGGKFETSNESSRPNPAQRYTYIHWLALL